MNAYLVVFLDSEDHPLLLVLQPTLAKNIVVITHEDYKDEAKLFILRLFIEVHYGSGQLQYMCGLKLLLRLFSGEPRKIRM